MGSLTVKKIDKIAINSNTDNKLDQIKNIFESSNLVFDTEGRVQFSKRILNFAKIKTDILFVGLGKTFQVWDPKNFEKFKSFARKKALQSRSTLKWDNN